MLGEQAGERLLYPLLLPERIQDPGTTQGLAALAETLKKLRHTSAKNPGCP